MNYELVYRPYANEKWCVVPCWFCTIFFLVFAGYFSPRMNMEFLVCLLFGIFSSWLAKSLYDASNITMYFEIDGLRITEERIFMKKNNLHGFVFAEERFGSRYMAPLGLVILAGFAVILWLEAFKHSEAIYDWFALGWTVFVLFAIIGSHSTNAIVEMQFQMDTDSVQNIGPKSYTFLSLTESFCITTLVCELSYGKGTVKRAYYLIAPKPFTDECIEYEGLKWVKRLKNHGIVVIPKTEETVWWVTNHLGISEVPSFPKFVCSTRDSKDGMPLWIG